MPLNASQLAHKVDDLRGLHEHTGHWDYRTRIRKIINGGSGHAARDTITFPGANIGSSSDVTISVVSVVIGDVVYIKNGVY